jgi:transcriptional regulator with XRE-family HTH domain
MGRKRSGPATHLPPRARQFATRLNDLMAQAGMTPDDVATSIGKSIAIVHHYLRGTNLPRLLELPELARALGLASVKDLLPDEWDLRQKMGAGLKSRS